VITVTQPRGDSADAARRLSPSSIARQGAGYAGSALLSSALGLVGTVVLAHELGASSFGSYSFAVAFLLFVAMFADLGLFLPASRLLATVDSREQRSIVGAAWLVFVPTGVLYVVAVELLSFGVDSVFNVHAGAALRWAAPLAVAYPLFQAGLQLSQGVARLHVYSTVAVLAQGLFVAAVLVWVWSGGPGDTTAAVVIRAGAFACAAVVLVAWLRPVFRGARVHIQRLVAGARGYGFEVYVGRVLSMGTYNMDTLMVAAFANARSVGYYALAGSIATASGTPVLGFCNALFPRMVHSDRIDRRWISVATGLSAGVFVAAIVLAGPAVRIVFGSGFAPVVPLVIVLVLAQGIRSVTGVYNTFLSARGRGKELRNAALVLAGSNLVLNFALIPPFGATGAAWASVVALVANLGTHVFYYRRSLGGVVEGVAHA